MILDLLQYQTTIAASDYIGWVVYVDGTPIFEKVVHPAGRASVIAGGLELPTRHGDRKTMEWKKLPHSRIQGVELYFARHRFERQPAVMLLREPGHELVRFIQMKQGAIQAQAIGGEKGGFSGIQRTGLFGYRIGYWDPKRQLCEIWTITMKETTKTSIVTRHPALPIPLGLGIDPGIMGYTPDEVPHVD